MSMTDTHIHPGLLQNAVARRGATQPPIEPEIASWPALRVAVTVNGYEINNQGTYSMRKSHAALTTGRFGGKGKDIDPSTFALICDDETVAATYRDEEIAEAARQYAEANRVTGYPLSCVNNALLMALSQQHGCVLNDLANVHQFLTLPPRTS